MSDRALSLEKIPRGLVLRPRAHGIGDYGKGHYGTSLLEWAYKSPRFPQGITPEELHGADSGIQRETALLWFFANLKPFELSTDGSPFAFAHSASGWGVGRLAPTRVNAVDALAREFQAALPPALLMELGEGLGSNWIWIDDPIAVSSTAEGQTAHDLRSSILRKLDSWAEGIRTLGPAHGQIGHNSVSDELPVTAEERADALEAVRETKAALMADAGVLAANAAWSRVGSAALKLATWAAAQADAFVSALSKEGGEAVGKELPSLLALAVGLWLDHAGITALISAYFAHGAISKLGGKKSD